MSRQEEIGVQEEINSLRAKQRKLGCWEIEKAQEIKHLIMQQSQIEDDIIELEIKLATLKSNGSRLSLLTKIGRML